MLHSLLLNSYSFTTYQSCNQFLIIGRQAIFSISSCRGFWSPLNDRYCLRIWFHHFKSSFSLSLPLLSCYSIFTQFLWLNYFLFSTGVRDHCILLVCSLFNIFFPPNNFFNFSTEPSSSRLAFLSRFKDRTQSIFHVIKIFSSFWSLSFIFPAVH